jgi:hypothetical protein
MLPEHTPTLWSTDHSRSNTPNAMVDADPQWWNWRKCTTAHTSPAAYGSNTATPRSLHSAANRIPRTFQFWHALRTAFTLSSYATSMTYYSAEPPVILNQFNVKSLVTHFSDPGYLNAPIMTWAYAHRCAMVSSPRDLKHPLCIPVPWGIWYLNWLVTLLVWCNQHLPAFSPSTCWRSYITFDCPTLLTCVFWPSAFTVVDIL